MHGSDFPKNDEIKIANIKAQLESLMVNLAWPTEPEFKGKPAEEIEAKLEQIKSYIQELKGVDPKGYARTTLEALGRMAPTMHKAAIIEIMDLIKTALNEDENYV